MRDGTLTPTLAVCDPMSKSKRTQLPPSKREARQLAIDRSKNQDQLPYQEFDQSQRATEDGLDSARQVFERFNAQNRFLH